jgi:T5SS/PEP-CTERM-associated repeat protein
MGVHAIFAGVDEYDVGLETQYFSSSDFFFIDQTIANLVGGGQLLGNILTMNDDAVLKVGANTTCQMLRSDYFDSSMLIIEPEGRFTSGSPFRMHDDTVLLVDSAELSAADLLVTADSIAQITNGSVAASGGAAIGRSNPAILGTLNSSSTIRVLEQSTWNNNFAIEVGENANSFLNPGSTDAVLSIQSGSRVTTNDCSIGLVRSSISSSIQALAPTTFGEVNVTSDSTFDVSDTLIVGEKANGTLNILSNGQVSAANLIIADGEHSTGAVFVTGQSTLNADNVFVGVEGAGTLNLANSTMNAGSCMIGSSSGIAHVVVDSSTMNSQIQVGGALGQGTLTIRSNGSVNVDNGSVIGINGTLELEGGELRHISANGSLRIDGTLLTSGGSVFLEDETLLTPTSSTETAASTTSFEILEHNGDEFCIPPSGRVVVTETFRGTSSFSGTGMVEFQGFVALGNTGQPMASVTVPNAVLGDDSELIANIYGTQPGIDHDRLVAMDSLTIEGLAIMSLSIGPDADYAVKQLIRSNQWYFCRPA